MRRLAIAVLVFSSLATGAAGAGVLGGGHRPGARVTTVRGAITVDVAPGWHVIRGWLSDVAIPIPRLALASFPARLSHHACACGFPNLRRLPSDGAFLFVWEYPDPSRRELARTPPRPARLALNGARPTPATCPGPSDTVGFRTGNRVFQVEIYLGPAAGARVRRALIDALDSFRAQSATVSAGARAG